MEVPCIGIAALDRVLYVYNNVGMGENVVPADNNSFKNNLIEQIKTKRNTQAIENSRQIIADKKANTLQFYNSIFNQ